MVLLPVACLVLAAAPALERWSAALHKEGAHRMQQAVNDGEAGAAGRHHDVRQAQQAVNDGEPSYGVIVGRKWGQHVDIFVGVGSTAAFEFDEKPFSGAAVKFNTPVKSWLCHVKQTRMFSGSSHAGFSAIEPVAAADTVTHTPGLVMTATFADDVDMASVSIDYRDPAKTYIELRPDMQSIKFGEPNWQVVAPAGELNEFPAPALFVISGASPTAKEVAVHAAYAAVQQVRLGFSQPVDMVLTELPAGLEVAEPSVLGAGGSTPTSAPLATLHFEEPVTLADFAADKFHAETGGVALRVAVAHFRGELGHDPCAACSKLQVESASSPETTTVEGHFAASKGRLNDEAYKCTAGVASKRYVASHAGDPFTERLLSYGDPTFEAYAPELQPQSATECYMQDTPAYDKTAEDKIFRCTDAAANSCFVPSPVAASPPPPAPAVVDSPPPPASKPPVDCPANCVPKPAAEVARRPLFASGGDFCPEGCIPAAAA